MQQQHDTTSFLPHTLYNPGYTNSDITTNVAAVNNMTVGDHKPPIPGSNAVGANVRSTPGASSAMAAAEAKRAAVMVGSRHPTGHMTAPGSGLLQTRGTPGTVYTPGAAMSSQLYGSPAMYNSNSSLNHSVTHIVVTGQHQNQQPGSNYSSPRSSIGSVDSKGSSPRTSLVNPALPPMGSYDRHGGSPHSGVGSPHSSIGILSQDVKHSSSPRGSLVNTLYDKFPSPRGSIASTTNEKYIVPRSTSEQNVVDSLYENMYTSSQYHGMHSARSSVSSLMDRYNEPAPPPPYELKHKLAAMNAGLIQQNQPGSSLPFRGARHVQVSTPLNSQLKIKVPDVDLHHMTYISTQPNVLPNSSAGIPVTVQHSQIVNYTNQQPSLKISAAQGNKIPNVAPVAPPVGNGVKSRLQYDVMPPRQTGPTDVEKKLAALTEQLEREMQIGGGAVNNAEPPASANRPPPPPYHGPHQTEAQPGIPSNSVPYSPSLHSSSSSLPNMKNMGSLTNLRSPLPFQVIPPQNSGPSEAEKKLEALTAQLENEMENNPQGDYYGKSGNSIFPLQSQHFRIKNWFIIISQFIVYSVLLEYYFACYL